MHRIWTIPELVDEILDWLPALLREGGRGRAGQRPRLQTDQTYLSLSQTAKIFWAPASKRLWAQADVVSLLHVFRMSKKFGEDKQGLRRLSFFQDCVRKLYIDGGSDDVRSLVKDYRRLVTDQPTISQRLFPSLTELVVEGGFREQRKTHARIRETETAATSLAFLVLGPSLRSLTYTCAPLRLVAHVDGGTTLSQDLADDGTLWQVLARDGGTTLLQTLAARCPNLSELAFSAQPKDRMREEQEKQLQHAFCGLVHGLPELAKLSYVIQPFGSSTLVHVLAQKASLRKLTLDSWSPDRGQERGRCHSFPHAPAVSDVFPTLSELHVTGDDGCIARMLPDPAPEMQQDRNTIKQMPCLTSVHLSSWERFALDGPRTLTTSSIINRLQFCKRIIHLKLALPTVSPLSDDDIELIANTWPGLESLSFRNMSEVTQSLYETTELTWRSLVRLATGCPRLCDLKLYFRHLEAPSRTPAFTPFRLEKMPNIVLLSYDQFDDDAVSQFLARLWPTMILHLERSHFLRSGTYYTNWVLEQE